MKIQQLIYFSFIVFNVLILGYLFYRIDNKWLFLGGLVGLIPVWVLSVFDYSITLFGFEINIGWIFLPCLVLTIYLIKIYPAYYLSNNKLISNILWGAAIGLFLGFVVTLVEPKSDPFELNILIRFLSYSIWVSVREEFYFRGFLLNNFEKIGVNPVITVLIQGFIFSLGHVYDLPIGILTSTLFGFLAGYITVKHKNIFGSIIGHIIINFLPEFYSFLS